jgi:predicted nucleic acid-binding protein
MAPNPRYYFDTNALWKYYPPGWHEDGSLDIRRFVSNKSNPILVSPLTVVEFFGRLMKHRRQHHEKRKKIHKLALRLRRDTGTETKKRRFNIVPLPDGVFRLAETILLEHGYNFDIGSNDALHLAIAAKLQAYFAAAVLVTSDNSMQKVCEKMQILFHDPENIA